MLALPAGVAQLGDRGRRVLQQAFLVGGIDPGARHHPGAVARADLVFHRVDQRVERGGIDQAFLDQERLERLDSQREVRRDRLMLVSRVLAWTLGADKIRGSPLLLRPSPQPSRNCAGCLPPR